MFRPDFPRIFNSPESRADQISREEQRNLLEFSKDARGKKGTNEWVRVVLLSILSTTLVESVFAGKAHADKTFSVEDISVLAGAATVQPFKIEALNKLIVFSPNSDKTKGVVKDSLSLIMPPKTEPLTVPDLGYTTTLTNTINIGAGVKPKIEKIKEESTFVGVLTICFE